MENDKSIKRPVDLLLVDRLVLSNQCHREKQKNKRRNHYQVVQKGHATQA